jgi:hypothetical protein
MTEFAARETPAEGVCFGYRPMTDLTLRGLRKGDGTPLVVDLADQPPAPDGEQPLLIWRPTELNPYHARLFAARGSTFRLWIEDLGWYEIDPGAPRIGVPPDVDEVVREQRLWGVPSALCFTRRGDLALHASGVEVDGRALLFVAPGRFGKTTLAAACVAAGHRLLTEDLACVRLWPQPSVLPGPPLLRLRPDVRGRLDLPAEVSLLRETPDRAFMQLGAAAAGSGDPVPLAGVVMLNISEVGELRLQRMSPTTGLPSLWITSFNVPEDSDRARTFRAVVELAGAVPLWELHRPLTIEGLPDLVGRVVSECLA